MPTYEYKCESCDHAFEDFLKIADRKKPTKKPCSACGKKEVKQVVLSCPSVGVDLSMDIHKAKGGFKDAMQKVCETPGIKNSVRSKYLKDRYNL
jgi:putative FmdB family regulatory protein